MTCPPMIPATTLGPDPVICVLLYANTFPIPSAEKFPSSGLFDAINGAIGDRENKADLAKAIKQANAIFGFVLKNQAGETQSWHVDLKETGRVAKGLDGVKPNVTLHLSDEDFGKLVLGEANPQRLFMAGKLKLKGDIMKALKLQPVLQTVQTKAKL
ncbi:fatty acid-binding protein [Purpureocillium lavendulum]|uniref:Fatty acid-binding protein n=1 Tax=Purpureocillium lavendulum TaxID=1247861 RepID=A0AB34G4D2_9HYPO|nr:fatty acid-binding protein [Purpureocillium lavendulum]